jgi:protein-tyrosine phosphatase
MIDIHSHILFGVDDGCETLEESLAMIYHAHKLGITDMILTPHHSKIRGYLNDKETLESRVSKLQEELRNQDITMNFHLGNEIDDDYNLVDDVKNEEALTLAGSKFVLIDFLYSKRVIDDVVTEIVNKGYIPIIAHPERYMIPFGLDDVFNWKKIGALIQVNAHSFFTPNNNEKIIAKTLLKYDLIDFVASDTHQDERRLFDLKLAYEYIASKKTFNYAEQIFNENPLKIIQNSKL